MASTFSDLGIELMATGENAGVWGTKTNTNLQIVEKAIAGYVEKSIAGGAQTTTLSITDGDTTESTSVARHAVIKLTGTITGNQVVTVPDSIEKVYIVVNGTSGSFTVQFKTASGTGVTFGASDKGTRLLFSDGTNIVDTGTGGVGTYDLNGDSLILDEDQDTTITADTDDQIDIAIAGADDFRFTANTFTALSGSSVVIPDGGLTLGSTAITSTAAELNILDGVTATATEINKLDGDTSATSTTVADADRVVLNDNGTMVQVAVTDLAAYFDDEITAMPNLTSVGTLTTLTVDNIIINGTNIGHTSDTEALAIDSSGNVTASQNLTVTGDLTVSGDDITMGTNTAGNLLIADGTNFNSVAVGSLSEISTIANDDVFLAVDTSGGGLKKVARSTVVSGLATSGAISNVVEDSTPQLGGDLDVNGNALVSTSNGNIALTPNGSGVVRIDGSNGIDIQSGSISIKNSGSQSYVDFYCESSNAHYARLQAPAHSAFSGNITLTLPATTDTVAGIAATQTFTNKTLTSPKINENVAVTATATEINILDGVTATTAELNILDGVTSTAAELNILDGVTSTAAELNILDGVTSTTAELNILDGVTSTASELNLLDGDTSVGSSITIADSDGVVVNDGGTMKTVPASDFKTLVGASAGGFSIANLDIDGGTDIGEAIVDADLFIVDNGAGGTNRKVAASRLTTYINANANFASVGKAIAMAIVFG